MQFWFKEERYYLRFLEQRPAIRIFHPRVWRTHTHMEFGVATFVGNDLNQDNFGAKVFVNQDDNCVYAVVDLFLGERERLEQCFEPYMDAIKWTMGEFRQRTEEAMNSGGDPASERP